MIKKVKLSIVLALSIVLFPNVNSLFAHDQIKSVKIGSQVWTTENLNVSHFRNGDAIPEAKTNKEWERAGQEGEPAWCYYDNDRQNGNKYGKLYNLYAANDERGLAPKGWRIPTKEDFEILGRTVNSNNGNALKAIGQRSAAASNTSEFPELLAGCRRYNGIFENLGRQSYFWSSAGSTFSEEAFAAFAFDVELPYYSSGMTFGQNGKGFGFSVRCIKD